MYILCFFFYFISFHFQKIILDYYSYSIHSHLFCRADNVDRWGTRNVHRQGQYDESHLRGTSQSWTTNCHLLDPWSRGIELLIYQYMRLKCVHANYFMLFRIYMMERKRITYHWLLLNIIIVNLFLNQKQGCMSFSYLTLGIWVWWYLVKN